MMGSKAVIVTHGFEVGHALVDEAPAVALSFGLDSQQDLLSDAFLIPASEIDALIEWLKTAKHIAESMAMRN